MSEKSTKYSQDLMAQLRKHNKVRVTCGFIQINFDNLLKSRKYKINRDYTRKEIHHSKKGRRAHIKEWEYELL